MGILVDTLQSFEDALDAWLLAATPATAQERAKLSVAELTDLTRLDSLRAEVQDELLRLISAELEVSASRVADEQTKLAAATTELKGLAKDIATLSSVLGIVGTVISITASIVGGALPLL